MAPRIKMIVKFKFALERNFKTNCQYLCQVADNQCVIKANRSRSKCWLRFEITLQSKFKLYYHTVLLVRVFHF